MRTIAIKQFGGPEVLEAMELPKPLVGNDEILIRLHAAGVNPVDFKIRQGLLATRLPHAFPLILGWDGAGEIEAMGAKVTGFSLGDAVYTYGRKATIQAGTYAQYITLQQEHLALKPKNLSFVEAAVVPLAALTAYQALFESLQIRSGETLLIPGGAGGVGSYALQLAVNSGARVFSTASPAKQKTLLDWGAEAVWDYHDKNYLEAMHQAVPGGFDAVFDTVGGDTQIALSKLLKPQGRLTSILTLQDKVQENTEIQTGYVFVRPDSEQLKKIATLIEEKKLRLPPVTTLPLSEAAEAHRLLEAGEVHGKLALEIPTL